MVIAGIEMGLSAALLLDASPRTAAAPPASVPSTPPVLTVVIPARCRASCGAKKTAGHIACINTRSLISGVRDIDHERTYNDTLGGTGMAAHPALRQGSSKPEQPPWVLVFAFDVFSRGP